MHKKLPRILTACLLALAITPLQAQTSDELRGGWLADIDGQRHIYYIVLRDDKVSGVYCNDCEDPHNLAFIDDGMLDDKGLRFYVYHYPDGSSPYREWVQTTLEDGTLHMMITSDTGEQRQQVMHRTPEADKVLFPIADFSPNQSPGGGPRVLPGPAETLTFESVIGMWLWGTGPTKQYFFFKEHKGEIRGMVCGPCYSVNDMAPLENITLQGSRFFFEIVHEDNGGGFDEHGPFSHATEAAISRNEMHMSTWPTYDPDGRRIEMTLLGPVVKGEYFRSADYDSEH